MLRTSRGLGWQVRAGRPEQEDNQVYWILDRVVLTPNVLRSLLIPVYWFILKSRNKEEEYKVQRTVDSGWQNRTRQKQTNKNTKAHFQGMLAVSRRQRGAASPAHAPTCCRTCLNRNMSRINANDSRGLGMRWSRKANVLEGCH